MRRLQVLALIALTALGVLASVGRAGAAPGDPWVRNPSFDLSAIPGGVENPRSIVVNHATGNVLLLEPNKNRIDQFDANGNPVNFSGTGEPTLEISEGQAETWQWTTAAAPPREHLCQLKLPTVPGQQLLWTFGPDGSPVGNQSPFSAETIQWGRRGGTGWDVVDFRRSVRLRCRWTLSVDPTGSNENPTSSVQNGCHFSTDPSCLRHPRQSLRATAERTVQASRLKNSPPVTSPIWARWAYLKEAVWTRRWSSIHRRTTSYEGRGQTSWASTTRNPLVEGETLRTNYAASRPPAALLSAQPVRFSTWQKETEVSVYRRESPSPPTNLGVLEVSKVGSDLVFLKGAAIANGAPTSLQFEFGTDVRPME